MIKFTRLLILCALFPIHFGLYAQSFVEVGTGNVETNLPSYTSWRYSYSSTIYLKEEIGGAKTITEIAFNNNFNDLAGQGFDYDLNNQKVWFKLVPDSQDAWTDMSYENPANNGYTMVWEGNIHYGAMGWYRIVLTTPFVYDGTSNLVMHWENRSNVEKSNFKFAATNTGLKQVKILGGDNSVPTGSGWEYYPNQTKVNVRFYYNNANEPANPELTAPVNAAIKVDLGTTLNFALGNNTEAYDLYLGTDINSMSKVVDNQTVSGAGNYSYQPSQLLESKKIYYWKVVARNSQTTKESNVYKFTTQNIIATFPYIQDFEKYWVSNVDPEHPDTLSSVINTNYPDSSDWKWDNYWACLKKSENNFNGLFSACVNAYSQGTYSLVTPRVNLPSNMRISFWWRNYYTYTTKTAANDSTFFQISVDGKNNWTTLLKLCGPANMQNYENAIVDLSAYSGNNVYFRWMYRSFSTNEAEPFLIDDVKIENIPTSAIITLSEQSMDFGKLVPKGKTKRKIIIYNTGTTNLTISGITTDGPFVCDFNKTIAPNQKDTATVYFAPTQVGAFNGTFSFNVNGAQGNATVNCTAEAIAALPQFFQNFDAVKAIPEGWVANQSSFAGTIVSNIWATNTSIDVLSSPNAIKMNRINSNDTLDAVILVTPGVTNYAENILSFYARKGGDTYTLEVIVGVMSDPKDTSTFVAKKTFTLTENYEQYQVQFKANTNEPYIGFKFGAWTPTKPFPYPSLRLEDVSWEPNTQAAPQAALIGYPENDVDSVDIMNGLKFAWSAGSSNTDGFKLYVGTTAACNELLNGVSLTQTQNNYSISAEALSFNTTYYWRVVPYNEFGDCAEPEVWTFKTMPDPTVTVYPMVETFDNTPNIPGKYDKPLGWTLEDTNNDRATWDMVNFPPAIQGFTRNDSKGAIHVPFHIINPKNDWLFTPPLSMKAGKNYTVEFYIHTMVDYTTGLVYNEKISVWLGKNRVSTAMTDSLVYDNVNQATTWKKVQASYTPTKDTVYYFGLHAISAADQYVLIVDDVTITETTPQSVTTEKLSKDLRVYPNPASQQLQFKIAEFNDSEVAKVSVWDMTGRKLYESQSSEKTINVSSFSNGFYILKVETSKKIYTQTFIVKQ